MILQWKQTLGMLFVLQSEGMYFLDNLWWTTKYWRVEGRRKTENLINIHQDNISFSCNNSKNQSINCKNK
jgi:hypothetical protein